MIKELNEMEEILSAIKKALSQINVNATACNLSGAGRQVLIANSLLRDGRELLDKMKKIEEEKQGIN